MIKHAVNGASIMLVEHIWKQNMLENAFHMDIKIETWLPVALFVPTV